jgi:hypothetical protein
MRLHRPLDTIVHRDMQLAATAATVVGDKDDEVLWSVVDRRAIVGDVFSSSSVDQS